MKGPLARFTAASTGSVSTWLQFAIGASLLIAALAAIDFIDASGRSFEGRTVSSVVFALKLAGGGAVAGILLWGVMRAIKGKDAVQGFRDSVLWSACVVAALVMFVRIIR